MASWINVIVSSRDIQETVSRSLAVHRAICRRMNRCVRLKKEFSTWILHIPGHLPMYLPLKAACFIANGPNVQIRFKLPIPRY